MDQLVDANVTWNGYFAAQPAPPVDCVIQGRDRDKLAGLIRRGDEAISAVRTVPTRFGY
jgi:hypothetical protein